MPGPLQDFFGNKQKESDKVRCTTAKVVFKTSTTLLQNFFPDTRYSFKSRDTVAVASVRIQIPTNLAWLGGGGYSLMGVYVHNVTYTAADGREYTGTYLPVMFENLADPIMTGREELGFPKVFSDIDIQDKGTTFKASLSWRGTTWAELSWPLTQTNGDSTTQARSQITENESILVHRQMPGVGDPGKTTPEGQYTAYCPSQQIKTKVLKEHTCLTPATLSFQPHYWRTLPTLHHIVARLDELPVLEVIESSVVDTEGWTDLSELVRIEA